MDPDLLQLVLLALLVQLLTSVAAPASLTWQHRAQWEAGSSVAGRPAVPCGGRAERRVGCLVPSAGGSDAVVTARAVQRGRRGGRGRARGRRATRHHRRGQERTLGQGSSGGGNGGGGLCLLSLNVQSVKLKILSLRHDLSHFNCDVCILTET